ncbi:MAG: DUF4136 domain-containing protein [Acidobacteriota bacterium]|nr:DUF4136 domain-containing protein [Acidobacteriota bacterium]MDH3785723.1 DUF4136 domain-containing protein [Acidobacteriota bacterium]
MRTILMVLALISSFPAIAELTIEHESDVDFSAYRTFAWAEGPRAARPEIATLITEAVERELLAKGLVSLETGQADLQISSHTFVSGQALTTGSYARVADFGVITSDVVVKSEGVLMIDLIDPQSGRTVWRGFASEVMGDPKLPKLRKKIDRVTRKMFRQYPPE